METVALDASVVIAFLDSADPNHVEAVRMLRHATAASSQTVISASAYAEVLVRPLERGLAGEIDGFLEGLRVAIVPVDQALARRAAEIRANWALRLPDAFVLATAIVHSARLLTLDRHLDRAAEALGVRTRFSSADELR